MKQWVTGNSTSAAKVDPTVGAVVIAVVDILVMLGVHTQLGLSEGDLLQAGLHVGTILLVARSAQLNIQGRRRKKAEPEDAETE
jgi:hypothetical protein